MSLSLLFVVLFGIMLYWAVTQVLPERKKNSMLRPGLADGVLGALNARRQELGLPLLEWDDDLAAVAENKATHQLLTGRDEDGWDYPLSHADLLGRSLLMETLFTGPLDQVIERMARQRDIRDHEWISCGIGVASGQSGQVVVAMILCREAWEAVIEDEPLAVSGRLVTEA
ncbi:MAG TPA: CAP domain-containing protein [Chloroflexota bacterium]|nr:CAP domain-containing protein [Chloroflexota bacterium]